MADTGAGTGTDNGTWAKIRKFIQATRADPPTPSNEFVERALEKDKREGLRLAVKARQFALAAVAILVVSINPQWSSLYFLGILSLFSLLGWAQLKVGRPGVSRLELALVFADLALVTITMIAPNPLNPVDWPAATAYRFGGFLYFFILLAGATMAYSWRTILAMGIWTTGLWSLGLIWVLWQPDTMPDITARLKQAVAAYPVLVPLVDLSDPRISMRIQEIVIFLIVVTILAINGRRAKTLLLKQASFEREASNLSRYFSPSLVKELAHHDQELKETRTQNIAVLFVDIVGFTTMSEKAPPEQTIQMLRQFLNAMESEVFRHNGTLDKYLGDGLMATFGTPFPTGKDASNALTCACAMIERLKDLNSERRKNGEQEIAAGFGLHFGPAVLGDIGANRLEFAVIGSTVNAAARLEALTRKLNTPLVVSDALMCEVAKENQTNQLVQTGFAQPAPQKIRGFSQPIKVWTLKQASQRLS